MTQLFNRLLASHFPHPPGPLGDFKVRKGHGLRFIPWEADPLSQTVTYSQSLLLQSSLCDYSYCISPGFDLKRGLISTALDVASDQRRVFIGADGEKRCGGAAVEV